MRRVKNRSIFFFLVFLFWGGNVFAGSAGQILELKGEVFIIPKGGSAKAAQFKEDVSVGDAIETKGGNAKILFVDDTVLTLKENTKTLITQFLFNPSAKTRKSVFDVAHGKIRTVVGKFYGNDQPVEIKTPTAVAGIRGTDVGADVGHNGTTFYCFSGKFDAFNVLSPDKVVPVSKGLSIGIVEGVPAAVENLVPFSPDVQGNFEMSALTQPDSKTGQKEGSGSSDKLVTQARSQTTPETGKSAAAPEAVADAVAAASEAAEGAEQALSNNPAEQALDTAALPGGTTESKETQSTTKISITIDFP